MPKVVNWSGCGPGKVFNQIEPSFLNIDYCRSSAVANDMFMEIIHIKTAH